jgi:flagellar basal-body rod protein FlgC
MASKKEFRKELLLTTILTILIAIFIAIYSPKAYAIKDDLMKTVAIAGSGSKFQAERIKVAAENIANEYSTAANPGGDPYRRKVIFPSNTYNPKIDNKLLITKKVGFDKSNFILKYEPNHPASNPQGYVKYPNVNKDIERADAAEAQRSYEANISVIEMSNSMMQKTMEAIR